MNNEPVFLVSEFSLRYLLIFKDQILAQDFSNTYQKKNSQMILKLEDEALRIQVDYLSSTLTTQAMECTNSIFFATEWIHFLIPYSAKRQLNPIQYARMITQYISRILETL